MYPFLENSTIPTTMKNKIEKDLALLYSATNISFNITTYILSIK